MVGVVGSSPIEPTNRCKSQAKHLAYTVQILIKRRATSFLEDYRLVRQDSKCKQCGLDKCQGCFIWVREICKKEYPMISVRLPDSSQRQFDHPVTVAQVATDIGPGLARAALAGRIND